MNNVGVHLTHCCLRCGCKYYDSDCPVETGRLQPEYLCSDCEDRKEDLKSELTRLTINELKEFSDYINKIVKKRNK